MSEHRTSTRHTTSKISSVFLNILLFTLILTGLSLGSMIADHSSMSLPGENRMLQPPPTFSLETLFSGQYTRQYDQYIADHFVFRSFFLTFTNRFDFIKGLPSANSVQLVAFEGTNLDQGTLVERQQKSEESLTTADGFDQILVLEDRAMELHRHNAAAIEAYACILNSFQAQLPGVVFYNLMIPTQVQFLEDEEYRSLSHDQTLSVQLLEDLLSPQISSVHVFEAFRDAPPHEVYFRTDHHWTARGAHLAYAAFMEQTHREPVPLENYDHVVLAPFLGSLYGATRHESLAKSPDTMEIFIPQNNVAYQIYPEGINGNVFEKTIIDLDQFDSMTPFGVFLGGDQPLSVIQGTANNNHRLLVVKDSFGNPFIPFLLPHYQEIHVIDPRLSNENLVNYVISQQVNEVLFLNYVLVHRYTGYAELLENMAR
ncbi:DHHW family protein [Anoxynatronum buryatiense]|uniref:DHHW protein n=1 Tax=Anoxynatronum buryatiense TaxID=489973 RepID=A0AA45WUX5_9CLOT|nr:DHHW family protein [Anoxynatronum buryatiense]SMP50816.1 DHHW protein [Anoxynatronum buryatiense]